MADDVKITSGRGFKYITNFVIHETREQKIILDFKYIPDKDGSLHHVDLEIIKQTKKPSESWDQSQITKTILTTEKPRQSLIRLITALKAQEDLFDREDTRAIILNPEEADLFKQVGSNVAFLKKILESFDTPEAKEQLA